eukprot:2343870-Amphidinium_carterae.1
MSDGAVRWRLQNQPMLMAQSALGEAHALRKWLIKFGSTLHEEGRNEIETVLQIMGVESGPTPIPPTRPYYQQLADASLVESYNAASAAEPTQIDVADTWHAPLHKDPFRDLVSILCRVTLSGCLSVRNLRNLRVRSRRWPYYMCSWPPDFCGPVLSKVSG